jgi:hypothetical protein
LLDFVYAVENYQKRAGASRCLEARNSVPGIRDYCYGGDSEVPIFIGDR